MSCILIQFQPGWAKDAEREEDKIKQKVDLGNVESEGADELEQREPEFTGNFGQNFLSSKLGQGGYNDF